MKDIIINRSSLYILKAFDEYGYIKSFQSGKCIDKNENPIPWYTYPAIEYLDSFDFTNKRVFEFGSGGSSLWWAERAKEVVSVENDENWHAEINSCKKNNMKIHLHATSIDYANAILDEDGLFDVIVIDGRFRHLCVATSLKKFSKTGMLILDNSDRIASHDEYKATYEILKKQNFLQVDFKGHGPINTYAWTTSIFFQRNFDFSFKTNAPSSELLCAVGTI